LEVPVVFEIAEKHEFFLGGTFSRIVGGLAALAFDLFARRYATRLIANTFENTFPSHAWTRCIEDKTRMHRQLEISMSS
jgi:hypothetical protein